MADSSGIPGLAELKKLKVVQLKALLSENGLPISGLKADLIERLHTCSLQFQTPAGAHQVSEVTVQETVIEDDEDTEEEDNHEITMAQSQTVQEKLPEVKPQTHPIVIATEEEMPLVKTDETVMPAGTEQSPMISPIEHTTVIVKKEEELPVISPVIKQHVIVPPGVEQHAVVTPSIEQHVFVPPIVEQHAVVTPSIEQHAVVPPSVEQHAVVPPSVDEQHAVVLPSVEQQDAVVPASVEQHAVILPKEEQITVVTPTSDHLETSIQEHSQDEQLEVSSMSVHSTATEPQTDDKHVEEHKQTVQEMSPELNEPMEEESAHEVEPKQTESVPTESDVEKLIKERKLDHPQSEQPPTLQQYIPSPPPARHPPPVRHPSPHMQQLHSPYIQQHPPAVHPPPPGHHPPPHIQQHPPSQQYAPSPPPGHQPPSLVQQPLPLIQQRSQHIEHTPPSQQHIPSSVPLPPSLPQQQNEQPLFHQSQDAPPPPPMDRRNGPPAQQVVAPKPLAEPVREPVAVVLEEVKGKKKRKKKKKKKKPQRERHEYVEYMDDEDDVEIEYVPEQLGIDPLDPNYSAFSKIFEAFRLSDSKDDKVDKKSDKKEESALTKQPEMKDHTIEEDEDEDDGSDVEEEKKDEDDKPKLSKKKLRKMNRLSVAELKQLVQRPDVVEMHDVTALDPKLLVYLKAYRNTVPVPRHWCFKRKYLQGKRGVEKLPFDLPEFIKKTGIMEMRAAMQEKEDAKTMKSKMREKVRPKMGKIDIDYQKLHDAFFKWQTKPKMTIHGDLYYEGKEYETKLKEKKPGDLSDDLRTALGMPTGPNKQLVPPPWLIAMQRYGPPPSYPNLKIPGLNAPIPEGASFGYHAGGWGKPPVDQLGQPLYGDVFGIQLEVINVVEEDDQIERAPWGELESESESEEEESESEEEGPDQTGLMTPAETGLITPSGLSSVPAGMETPDMIELRKRKTIEEEMEMGDQPSLYTVIPEKKASVGAAMMGSAHIYDIAQVQGGPPRKGLGDGIEVALDPSELELDPAAMQARYEQQMRERESQLQKEDLSDMVAEHAAKQKKRKKATDSGKAAKKYKEFKF